MSPPGTTTTNHGITGTHTKAETKRVLAARIIRAMRAAGMEPQGHQVRSLLATILAANEEPTDQELVEHLMRAPWHRKPKHQSWRIGQAGWRTSS